MNPESLKEFQALAVDAGAGQLFLSGDAAAKAAKACQDRIDWLQSFANKAANLAWVSAFGYFGSAQALGKKFESLATGGPGSGSFEDIVQGHIDVVKQMKETFEKAGAAYEAADQATRDNLVKVASTL